MGPPDQGKVTKAEEEKKRRRGKEEEKEEEEQEEIVWGIHRMGKGLHWRWVLKYT